MRKLATMLMAAAGVLAAGDLRAQTTAAANASIVIGPVLAITVDQVTVTFVSPTADDYTSGSITSGVNSTIATRANIVHDVTVAADALAMTYTGTAVPAPTKPASDLQWSKDAGTSWTGLSPIATDVATAVPQGTNAAVAVVGYRMLLDLATDVPGTYSLNFTYTVVAN